jgi:rSAM/selenodomain-associated transferase 2
VALERALARLFAQPAAVAADSTESFEVLVAFTAEDRLSLAPIAREYSDVTWIEASRGRAAQMNAGAARARGDWLLFLHADTVLDGHWSAAVAGAERRGGIALGCFTFALDATAHAARVIERGVAWRVRVLRLPYGDQALFLRRSLFLEMGGYADIPIMEDVDLVRRALRRGDLYVSPLVARTSARRWEQQGWTGRTLLNLGLLFLYAVGIPPEALIRIDRARHL